MLCALFVIAITLAACNRSWVHVGTLAVVSPTADVATPEWSTPTKDSSEIYAVVWLKAEETVILRKPAGISGAAVSELAYDQRGIRSTGNRTELGSSTWIEIYAPSGGTGWVNGWNLTEGIAASDFCSDMRVNALLEDITQALINHNGGLLASLVNPERGLTLRHNWWNPDVLIPPDSVGGVFSDLTEVDWGVLSSSDFPIRGSFRQIMVPQLEDVFLGPPEIVCNELTAGMTSKVAVWPEEFKNMNFYTFHRSAPEGGNKFNWRTWGLGIEYIEDQPYLSVLIQYRGDL